MLKQHREEILLYCGLLHFMLFLIFITKKHERGIWLSHYLWPFTSSASLREDFSYVFFSIPLNFKLL